MSLSRAELVTASSLAVVGGFQVALAVGDPWGRAAYGGSHVGVLPGRLRAVSAVAAVGYVAGASAIVTGAGDAPARARGFGVLAVFMGVGALANGASRSPVERAVWTPVTVATAVAAWRAGSPRR